MRQTIATINLIAMRVIKDNGHKYITDKGNTFVAIMGKDNCMLVRFDYYDPKHNFYKVKADHAVDFMKTPEYSAEECYIALSNALVDMGKQRYESKIYFTAEQRRRAALVPPMHIALNHPSDAALTKAINSPSLMNCPTCGEDIVNARIIYGRCKECNEGKPHPSKGYNETLDWEDIIVPEQLLHVFLQCRRLLRIPQSHPNAQQDQPSTCTSRTDTYCSTADTLKYSGQSLQIT